MPVFELLYRESLRRFLQEDLGVEGDVTSKFLNIEGRNAAATVCARQEGVAAGLCFIQCLFQQLDLGCRVETRVEEGSEFGAGASLLLLTGPSQALLAGERTALNLLSRMFGIATQVRRLNGKLLGTQAKLLPTRKTLPGLRFFDKYAAEVGGASRHRYGLNDAIMIKDNHLVIGGGIAEVLLKARSNAGHMLTIEIECDTLSQLEEVLKVDQDMREQGFARGGADVVLLDNMSCDEMKQAVSMVKEHPGGIYTEASGGISESNLRVVAETGVDFISMGALTHTVQPVDLGLDFLAN